VTSDDSVGLVGPRPSRLDCLHDHGWDRSKTWARKTALECASNYGKSLSPVLSRKSIDPTPQKWLWVKTLVPGWYTNIAGKWMVIPP